MPKTPGAILAELIEAKEAGLPIKDKEHELETTTEKYFQDRNVKATVKIKSTEEP